MTLTLKEISALLGISYPETADKHNIEIDTLLTDSRSLSNSANVLFFALHTSRNDGHNFIPDLYQKGVRYFVVDHLPENPESFKECVFLQVADTSEALLRIGSRSSDFKGEMVGITGSRGKTTLKEWIFQLMEPFAAICRSPRSYNSHIGVPLSMWEIEPEADIALIEAGVSKSGEMEPLSAAINADTVILTNIGDAHSGGFTDKMEKAHEKCKLIGPDTHTVIYNGDDQRLFCGVKERIARLKGAAAKEIRWSLNDPSADLYISKIENCPAGKRISYIYENAESCIEVPLEKDFEIENAINALAYMLHRNIARDTIASRMKSLHKIGTRLNVNEGSNGCSVIYDSYTSDFSSLGPALDFMQRRATPEQHPVLIMSDLHHEGSDGREVYRKIAHLLNERGVTEFVGVGPMFIKYHELFEGDEYNGNARFFISTDQLLEEIEADDFSDAIILVKGSPEYNFDAVSEMLEIRKHETVLEVNLDSIVKNYNYFRGEVPPATGIVCMVKASGYGAGSYEIAKTLQDCGAAYLAVAVLDEGIALRRRGITMPIMVMNPKVANYKSMFDNDLEPEIYSFAMLNDVMASARKHGIKRYPVHIKLDTGMHRMGFVEDELPKLMDILNSTDAIEIKSAFSHLATADCPDMDDYTELQLNRFHTYTEYMLSRSSHRFLRHVLNTAGILRYPAHHYDMVRLGIGLYGANTLPPEMEKPLAVVSSLKTSIIAIHNWKAGETIGYSRKGILKRDSRVATIPIGYADGMNRHFGRGAITVKINGKDAPTIGNICMDACMIDVTGIDCEIGDEVEIFGKQAPLHRLSELLDTIPYEILTSVSPRVKRIYYRE